MALRVLMITSEWPTPERPEGVPFIVEQVASLRKKGIDIELFVFRGKKNPLRYLKAWFELKKKYKGQTFDLVHAQFAQSLLLALPTELPTVVTFRGDELYGIINSRGSYSWQGWILRLVGWLAAQRADWNIVVSKAMAERIPSKLNVSVIPSGVDVNLFRPASKKEAREKLGLPQDRRLVLFVGRPDYTRKRLPLAQKAVEILNREIKAELLNVHGIRHEEMPAYMNACDVFLLTSKHEGSPNVVKEALACDLPVVSVNVGDVAERLSGIRGSVLCENDSPECIARGLAQVLKNPEPVSGEQIRRELNLEVIADEIIRIYQKILRK